MTVRYIATFFSHFGAIRFNKELEDYDIKGIIKPVPRSLSSSCGTCVEFEVNFENTEKFSKTQGVLVYENDNGLKIIDKHNEIEQVVEVKESGYSEIYKAIQ